MNIHSFLMNTMARKNSRKEDIINAAIKIFAQKGFYNAKVADVAREAGIADGTIYLYFKNKDDLLISLFESKMEESYGSSKWRNILIVILLIVFVDLMTFEQGLIPTNVAPIQLQFGIGPEFIGYFVGSYTLTLATMTLFFGYFTDKRKRIHLLKRQLRKIA